MVLLLVLAPNGLLCADGAVKNLITHSLMLSHSYFLSLVGYTVTPEYTFGKKSFVLYQLHVVVGIDINC